MKRTSGLKYAMAVFLVTGSTILPSCKGPADKKNNDKTVQKMEISKQHFGTTADGQKTDLYTLVNQNGVTARITNYGGIVTELLVPDRDGKLENVVLGFDSLQAYLDGHPYFGAIVGRYGNRIARGKFTVDGIEYTLAVNNGENHLHGGLVGFDKVVWAAESFRDEHGVGLHLYYVSKDMEEGYPGNLTVKITYLLTNEDKFRIDYKAETDKACPVNLTHHSYFNLTSGRSNVLGHEMMINASRYVVVDDGLIPTGELREVSGSVMDFSTPYTIGSRIDQVKGGYDHTFVLNKADAEMTLAARVFEPVSGRAMEVLTTEPGVQFYTGNFLDGSLTGKNGVVYARHFGFCLETQHFPDSPNQPGFPSALLRPGETYTHTTTYKFFIE